MKNYYSFVGIVLASFLFGFGSNSIAQTTFNYTGAMQTYTVPAGVNMISIEAYGAQGGTSDGGQGGYAYGELAVSPGQDLYIYVGGQGSTVAQPDGSALGGWNGGGFGGSGVSGSSGGGASDVRAGGTTLNDRVIVAGGGGGMDWTGSSNSPGGDGGGTVGGPGTGTSPFPTGGDQAAGGNGSTSGGYSGTNGSFGQGGTTALYSGSTYQYVAVVAVVTMAAVADTPGVAVPAVHLILAVLQAEQQVLVEIRVMDILLLQSCVQD